MAGMEEADLLDPNPDIHALFMHYNHLYFEEKLGACSVAWSSSRMTLCAGVCQFVNGGGCAIRLSQPLLKYRNVADLKDTLLHEMIHAYLFLTDGNKDHDDHGPSFQAKMLSINNSTIVDFEKPKQGYHISIYHSFKDEVDNYRVHHWTCFSCGNLVKRSINRAPSAADCRYRMLDVQACSDTRCSWHMHEKYCGGNYVKTAEPTDYVDRRKCSKDGTRKGKTEGESEDFKQTNGRMPKSHSKAEKNNAANVSLQKSRLEAFFASKDSSKAEQQSNSEQAGAEVAQLRNDVSNVGKWMEEDTEAPIIPIEDNTPKFEKDDTCHSQESPGKKIPETLVKLTSDNAQKRRRNIELFTSDDDEEPNVVIAWKGWWASEYEEEGSCQLIDKRQRRCIHERPVGLVQHSNDLGQSKGTILRVNNGQLIDSEASAKSTANLDLDDTCFQEQRKSKDSCVHIISSQSDPERGECAENIDTICTEASTDHIDDIGLNYENFSLDQIAESEQCHHLADPALVPGNSSLHVDLTKVDHTSFSGDLVKHKVPPMSPDDVIESHGERARLVLDVVSHAQFESSIITSDEHPKQDYTMRCPFCDKILVGDINNYEANEDINKHIDACLARS